MVTHNMIASPPNIKGDLYFVNSKTKLAEDKRKECNSTTKNKSNGNLESMSNIELEGRSPCFSFNCITPSDSK